MPDQKTMRTRCLGGFSVMWVTKLLISPVKKGFFAQKWPNLAQNWHFSSFWARPCRLILFPPFVGWLVVVARGLYLVRHLFTFLSLIVENFLVGLWQYHGLSSTWKWSRRGRWGVLWRWKWMWKWWWGNNNSNKNNNKDNINNNNRTIHMSRWVNDSNYQGL